MPAPKSNVAKKVRSTPIRPLKDDVESVSKWRGIVRGASPVGMKDMNAWIREMRGDRNPD